MIACSKCKYFALETKRTGKCLHTPKTVYNCKYVGQQAERHYKVRMYDVCEYYKGKKQS